MTPFERTHPKMINGSRRARIARGSGVQVTEVNQLLERFTEAQKMMSRASPAAVPASPACRACPAWAAARQGRKQQQRKKAKSRQPRQARRARSGPPPRRPPTPEPRPARSVPARPGAGDGGIRPTVDPASLPKGFEKFLGR